MRTGFLVLSCTALVWRIPRFSAKPEAFVETSGTSREIRTHTVRVLSALSLPIGLGRHILSM